MAKSVNPPTGGYSKCNQVQLIRGGKEYFDLLSDLIDRAKSLIHFQYYIFDEDETGKAVKDRLVAASKRGVKVYMVLDGFASNSLSSEFVDEIQAGGIHFRWFEPLLKGRYFYFGRRMHHKVLVIDGKEAVISGLNISNRYNDLPDQPAWLDFGVLVSGETALELCQVCADIWRQARWKFKKEVRIESPKISPSQDGECSIRIRRNDWVKRKNQITRSYLEMLGNSKEEITIMSSYFMPGKILRRFLKRASRSGVKIKIIVAGVSDIAIAKQAERYMYAWLLRHNIRLFEYRKVVLHAKIAISDKEWVTIGSYNVNNISTYASLEMNLDIRNPEFANKVNSTMEEIMTRDCEEITEENFHLKHGILRKFSYWASYQVVRILFYVFTFYFKQQR